MGSVELRSEGGTVSTYRWRSGQIDWEGERMMAFILEAMPLEGGLDRSTVVVNRILSNEPALVNGLWGAFVHYPQGTQSNSDWRVLAIGEGKHVRQCESVIPNDIAHQLASIPDPS